MYWRPGLLIMKDAQAVKDYRFDWSSWLGTDTINAHTIIVDDGLKKDSSSPGTSYVDVWLSGGTAGQRYGVTCQISTAAGRTDERRIEVLVT